MLLENEPGKYLTAEEIELKLNKIDELEIVLEGIKSELRVMNKRIERLQKRVETHENDKMGHSQKIGTEEGDNDV